MPSGSTAAYDDSVLFHILVSVVVSSIVRTASNGFSSPTGAFAVASNGLSETVSRVASAILSLSGSVPPSATDYSRRTSPADQRQRLSGHRYQVYRHRHIRQGLDDNQQSAAQHQEFRKELITSTSNHPHPDKQDDIQEQDKDTPDDSHLFYNNGIDKVRVSLRQKVALLPMSGELPEQTATC